MSRYSDVTSKWSDIGCVAPAARLGVVRWGLMGGVRVGLRGGHCAVHDCGVISWMNSRGCKDGFTAHDGYEEGEDFFGL